MSRAFYLLAPLTCVLALAPVAEAKPKFRNGMAVEAQGPDGRWYRAKVWKVKPGNPAQYELRFEGMPSNARQWLPEDKLRASGGGPVVDPAAIKAVIAAKQHFRKVVAHGKQGKWTNERWNRDLDTLIDQLEAKVKGIQAKWPQEPLGNLPGLPAKLRANAVLRRKQQGGGAKPAQAAQGEGAKLEAYYRKAAKAAGDFPYDLTPQNLADRRAAFADLDLVALEARIAEDSKRFPAVFAYYGRQNPAKYGDMKYGGPKAPQIANKDLKRVHQFHLPKIFQLKARLKGKEQVLAETVAFAMSKGKSVDDAFAALQLGRAIRRCVPQHAGLEAQIKAAEALVETRLKAFAPLMKGPFHRQHLRQLVAFSQRQTLGSEQAGQVVAELTPGKPLYLVGYLTESVQDLGFKRRDSKLGYETTRLPDLKFRLKGTSGQPFRLPIYSKVQGKGLAKVGAVVIDLQPDPSTTYSERPCKLTGAVAGKKDDYQKIDWDTLKDKAKLKALNGKLVKFKVGFNPRKERWNLKKEGVTSIEYVAFELRMPGKTGENLSEKIMGYAVLGSKAAKRFNQYGNRKVRKKTWKAGTWIRGTLYAKGSGKYPASIVVDYVGKVK